MKDAKFTVTKALPNANATNQSPTIDLNVEAGGFDNKFRLAYLSIAIPALSDHTDNTKTNTFRVQDSADNVTFADVVPRVEVELVGVTTTGSAAVTVKVPLIPNIRRYVQITQTVPTGGGTGSNATITYDLVV